MTAIIAIKIKPQRDNYYLIPQLLAFCIVAPLTWMASDREPPWMRLSGEIAPVIAGKELSVHWYTTPLVRDCPGTLQVEIISTPRSGGPPLIWPQSMVSRPVSSSLKIGQTEYTPKPWPVDSDIPPGPAIYRVTSFWNCPIKIGPIEYPNPFQDIWPITQVGPDVPFLMLPKEK